MIVRETFWNFQDKDMKRWDEQNKDLDKLDGQNMERENR